MVSMSPCFVCTPPPFIAGCEHLSCVACICTCGLRVVVWAVYYFEVCGGTVLWGVAAAAAALVAAWRGSNHVGCIAPGWGMHPEMELGDIHPSQIGTWFPRCSHLPFTSGFRGFSAWSHQPHHAPRGAWCTLFVFVCITCLLLPCGASLYRYPEGLHCSSLFEVNGRLRLRLSR
jgi:hypothetical protein